MKTFAQQFPGFALKGVKTFRGMEGEGFNAKILKDGQLLCLAMNAGNGGQSRYEWHSDAARKSLEDLVEEKRAEIPADQVTEGFNDRKLFNMDILIEEMLCAFLEEKSLLRVLKKKTIFETGGKMLQIPKPYGPEVKAFLQKKYPTDLVILNETMVAHG
jgi:hypothetical protein